MANTVATWSIELNCECPKCNEDVNLLDYADFWDGVDFEVGEHNTNKTKNVEVMCPECNHEFVVDFEY